MNIWIFTLVAIFIFETETQTCSDPNTTCKLLKECPSLRVLLKPTASPEDLKKLTDAQCSKETIDTGYRVCCPRPPCTTPHGIQGKCKDIHECPYLLDLLRSGTTENITYIQNSRCGENQEVCCIRNPSLVCLPSPKPNTDDGCCGRESIQEKIFNGKEAGISEFPWMALLEYVHNNEIILNCGGALISSRYVLTAAHCVTGELKPKRVRLGEHNTTTDPDCVLTSGGGTECNKNIVRLSVKKIIAHEDYNKMRGSSTPEKQNDIALLQLKRTAPYTEFIRPICLPSKDYSKVLTSKDKFCVAGWGRAGTRETYETAVRSTVKLYADVPFVDKKDCDLAYGYETPPYFLSDGQLCAGGEDGKDTCDGDSGGPLMYQNGLSREIVGIVSFGSIPCGSEAIPTVYTNVYLYLPWIYENTKQ